MTKIGINADYTGQINIVIKDDTYIYYYDDNND
jgi:hypothetical protein